MWILRRGGPRGGLVRERGVRQRNVIAVIYGSKTRVRVCLKGYITARKGIYHLKIRDIFFS